MYKSRLGIAISVLLGAAVLVGIFIWMNQYLLSRPITGKLRISAPSLQSGTHSFQAGNFRLQLIASGDESAGRSLSPRVVILHQKAPGKWLWYTQRGDSFVAAGVGSESVTEQRGSYFFSDHINRRCADQSIDEIITSGDTIVISGQVRCNKGGPVGYALSFSPAGENQLAFSLEFDDGAINRAFLTYASDADEHFFGFGEQFTYFDLKGHIVPIWISEQGIGRGKQPLTFLVDRVANAGGNPFTTYAAVPHYITSRMRSLFLLNSTYTEFDLRQPDFVQVRTFSPVLHGRILYGENPEDLITEYTSWAGRMRILPEWLMNGAVVGLQGGTEKVRQVYQQMKENGTPVSALWLQDWVGQRTTSFGRQLWWNWELDQERYPGWDSLRQELGNDDVRLMVYTSPFLVDVSQKPGVRRNYFKEALENGYLVMQPDGEPYLILNTDFSAGLVDLTNTTAREWYKTVLRESLVEEAGASGWMADFGEALPYDAVLASGETGSEFHNRYPEEWASLNRELVDSLQDGNEVVFFQRAAFQRSPAYSTLFWLGDQLVSWDKYDGIKSAVTGLLSGGISGLSLNHSDIGGYTTIDNPLARYHRSQELLMRWMELSAMSAIYRSHEGNLPDLNSQVYSNSETLAHFSRMARVYAAWKPLRKKLVNEAAQYGIPVARHLVIHYPDDPNVYALSFEEYMLGSDLLIAPVLDPEKDSVRAYLPAGNWVHLWTGRIFRSPYKGVWVTVPAPLGQPGIFYAEGSQDGMEFRLNLKKSGVID